MLLQVGVKAFLKNSEGKFLLLKRTPEKYVTVKRPWDLPGGRIEPGSPLTENLKREIREETQLEIEGEPKVIFVQDIIKSPEKHVVRLTYLADVAKSMAGREPVLDMIENNEYKWVTLDEMGNVEGLDEYTNEVRLKAADLGVE